MNKISRHIGKKHLIAKMRYQARHYRRRLRLFTVLNDVCIIGLLLPVILPKEFSTTTAILSMSMWFIAYLSTGKTRGEVWNTYRSIHDMLQRMDPDNINLN